LPQEIAKLNCAVLIVRIVAIADAAEAEFFAVSSRGTAIVHRMPMSPQTKIMSMSENPSSACRNVTRKSPPLF
jgi:hypothetical protein